MLLVALFVGCSVELVKHVKSEYRIVDLVMVFKLIELAVGCSRQLG